MDIAFKGGSDTLELWQILVAVLQGLVEWLPISSEGQVVFFIYNFTSISQDQVLPLVVWLHLGTALAVIVRYPRIILDIISLKDKKLTRLLFIATIATAITAIPLYILLENSIEIFQGEILNVLVGSLLIVTALALYLPSHKDSGTQTVEVKEPTDREALLTGLVQGSSVLPGLSRSGVTVSALLMQKIDRETALRFSFLMSVPAVLGILLLNLLTGSGIPASMSTLDLIIVEAIVFIVGLGSMEFLLRVARRVNFWKLCLLLGLVAIVFGIPAFFAIS
ncbi:MAG: undecaprenyl-diphosphate phosphatase [Candidatus Thorarchaeota archaeon]|nr:undecaprenyl-diphosphate phosphatase [Candidatus Thorarchaeota archaeon]